MAESIDPGDLEALEEIENLWIPLPDGSRLAARVWLPPSARAVPVPAILEYLPYRKRDFMRARDEAMHRYYALAGYASLRVDLRGSGDSDGVLEDEYTQVELADALAVIEWIAAQPWCSGALGMTGISWGGFNSLQVAALAPPALKAVITLCAADDRYADDAHYKGGCLLNENMQWGSILTLYRALPPDPEIVGEPWREMWRERIAALDPSPVRWMQHPARDAYWRHGSVCEDYAAIRCPVYAIGGWADGYSNAVSRLLEHLDVPRKGLIGPWAHAFPHDATPGPAIGYLQEAVRWWDHWLKGVDTGLMREPMLRVWLQESVPPQPHYDTRPGRWVAESEWPSPRLRRRRLHLDWGQLAETPGPLGVLTLSSPHTLGMRGGEWCGFGAEGEAPRDQRVDDGGSLVFDSDPLEAPLELLGTPVLEVEVRSNRPVAFLVARLCDVAPDGASLRISYGILNLCQRDGADVPTPLEPGRWTRVALPLDDLGEQVPTGHRLRLGLSTGYWPMIWPAPEAVTLDVRTGSGHLDLPERPPRAEDAALPGFAEPLAAPGATPRTLRPLEMQRRVEIDLTTQEHVYTLHSDGGELGGAALTHLAEIGLDMGYTLMKRYRIREDDPLSAQTELTQTALLRRGDWSVQLECRTRLSATANAFVFHGELEAREGDAEFATRCWDVEIPRRLL